MVRKNKMAGIPFTIEYYHEVEDQTPYQTDEATASEALGSNINYYYNVNLESGGTPEYHLLSDDFTSTDTWNDVYADIGEWIGDDVVPLYDLVPTPTPPTPVIPSYEHKVQNIYLGEPGGWRPGVDTIAYYEFNDNLEDSTENNNDLSISSGTASYQTVGNKKAFNINNDGTSTSHIEISQDLPTNLTVSVWCYFRQVTSSTYTKTLLMVQTANALKARIRAVPSRIYFGDDVAARIDNPTRNRRYYITMVRGNDGLYSYIDGSFIYKCPVAIQNIIYKLGGGTGTSKGDGMLSELIIESKARTAEEISDYYELTKGNYGL